MSRALPRPLVGLAASALAVGLVAAPLVAYAEPTPTPTPVASAAQSSADPSAETSASPSPTATDDPSGEASGAEASPSPTANPSASTGRVGADAIEAPSPSATPTTSESADVQAQAAAPAGISLTKTASRSKVTKVGQVITYSFVARNTGGVALSNVTIIDQLDGLKSGCPTSTTLAPGAALTCTATLTVTQDWMDFGAIDNSATVFGEYPIEESEETDYVGANASAHVSVDQKPAISLKASVSPTGTVDAGDRLRYAATATNTGNVTLSGARITSSLGKLDLDCDPSARATLAPGESMTCDGSYKVTTSDGRRGKITNKLTALARGPYDDQGVSDSVTLRSKVTKITSSSDSDPGLADTGGPDGALPVGVLGALALVTGVGLIRRSRRP